MGNAGRRAVRYRHAVYDKGTAALAVLAQDYARVIRTLASPHAKATFLVPTIRVNHKPEPVPAYFFFRDHRPRLLRISLFYGPYLRSTSVHKALTAFLD